MRRPATTTSARSALERENQKGQSLFEFALLLPVMLLLVMFALDFGRVYLGWINAQNMARIAANYAANNASAWNPPLSAADLAAQAEYRSLISNDARAINCILPNPLPDPVFPTGFDLGDSVTVGIPCRFAVITPIIGSVLGNEVLVSASSTFPVKQGAIASVPGGGGQGVQPPAAEFVASPTSGYAPLSVAFTDLSTNDPTSWIWSFGDGTTSFAQNPTKLYNDPGSYTVSLTVSNSAGVTSETKLAYIEALAPPTAGPVPEFTATPLSGAAALSVSFTDLSTGGATSWDWTFGDGGTSSSRNPTRTYANPGTYSVTLTVSDGLTQNSQTKTAYIRVGNSPCVVPNFAGQPRNEAQSIWDDAGFTTRVGFSQPGGGNYIINYQSLQGGLVDPPGLCDATIVVGP